MAHGRFCHHRVRASANMNYRSFKRGYSLGFLQKTGNAPVDAYKARRATRPPYLPLDLTRWVIAVLHILEVQRLSPVEILVSL
jgi:hypothetical protein